MHSFEYIEPRTVLDAVRHLSEYGARARVLAGGTDLLIQMETGKHRPEVVVNVARIEELRAICERDSALCIGATVPLRQVENHPAVVRLFPALARGCREVGSVQIRNLGTLGGNICNASPSADTSTALLAYDAVVDLAGPGGAVRHIPLSEFWLGPGKTVVEAGELLTSIRLPYPSEGTRAFYRKLAVRKAMDLAMVGVCVRVSPDPLQVRIALGAVGPRCYRALEAEAAVEQGGAAAINAAAALARASASPIDDQRASANYRRDMVEVLTARALRELLG